VSSLSWARVKPVLEKALSVSLPERTAVVAAECEGDEELRREVEEYLRYEGCAPSLLPATQWRALMPADDGPPPGRVGPWKILREIGRGGMGVVYEAFQEGLEALLHRPSVEVLAEGSRQPDGARTPTLLRSSVGGLLSDAEHLLAECFGPVSLVVEYEEESHLIEVAKMLEGQLTATVHGELDDEVVPELLDLLADKAGRIIWNGWPTSLAVTWAMQHGGPYPATTSPLHTSVGAAAIGRFLRPVTYQGMPDHLLPAAVREQHPLHLPRRVDGEYRIASGQD